MLRYKHLILSLKKSAWLLPQISDAALPATHNNSAVASACKRHFTQAYLLFDLP